MKRESGAVGFALYLDLLEQIEDYCDEYDVDTVLLYDTGTDPVTLTSAVNGLASTGKSIRVCTQLPSQLKFRTLLKLTDGRIETLEENG